MRWASIVVVVVVVVPSYMNELSFHQSSCLGLMMVLVAVGVVVVGRIFPPVATDGAIIVVDVDTAAAALVVPAVDKIHHSFQIETRPEYGRRLWEDQVVLFL